MLWHTRFHLISCIENARCATRIHNKFLKTFFDFKHELSTASLQSLTGNVILKTGSRKLVKTADWQSKARVKIDSTIRERFQKLDFLCCSMLGENIYSTDYFELIHGTYGLTSLSEKMRKTCHLQMSMQRCKGSPFSSIILIP